MRKDRGLTTLNLVFFIILIAVIIGLVIHFSLGKEGVLTKANQNEEEFSKSEVLDELNFTITEKYLGTYKNEAVNGKKIEEVYNKEIAINYLKEKGIIEDYVGEANKYYIKIESLRRDIKQGKGQNGSGKDVYIIEKVENTDDYTLFYIKNNGEKINIGNLQFEPEL